MPKLNSKEVGNLKLRIAALLNCSDLNASMTFVEDMQRKAQPFWNRSSHLRKADVVVEQTFS
jgi:hypothetical protein